jgi:uroporphyrin-III C-methyltransferase
VSETLVSIVGAGPGSADFLTLKGARLLAEAQVVLYDALVAPDVLAIAAHARLICVGKRAGRASAKQDDINQQIIHWARRYTKVVRLKGGDPSIFGRLDEEIKALDLAQIAYQVVPGITAASAAAAALGRSLTTRERARSLVLSTPRMQANPTSDTPQVDLNAIGVPQATVALYMAGNVAACVAQAWLGQGIPAETAVSIARGVATDKQALSHSTVGLLALGSLITDTRPLLLIREAVSTSNTQNNNSHAKRRNGTLGTPLDRHTIQL